jgi:hypothetical protein
MAPAAAVAALRALPGVQPDALIIAFAAGGTLAPDARRAFVGLRFMAIGNLFRFASSVAEWEPAGGAIRLLPFHVEAEITALALAGRTVLIATEEKLKDDLNAPSRFGLQARDADSGRLLWKVDDLPRKAERLAVSAQTGRILVPGGAEVLLVDVTSGAVRHRLAGHGKAVSSVAFSDDGKLALTGSHDQSLRIWDAGNGKNLATLVGHNGTVNAAAILRGNRLVSAGEDRTLRIWGLPRGEPLTVSAGFRTEDWITLTPEGYFTGSPRGAEQLGFRFRNKLYPLNQFYDAFYRPDLVRSRLEGQGLDALAPGALRNALDNPPPEVRVTPVADSAARPGQPPREHDLRPRHERFAVRLQN